MKNFLHIEINNGGLFVYKNNKKGKSNLLTEEDINEECCLASSLAPDCNNICLLEPVHYSFDLSELATEDIIKAR